MKTASTALIDFMNLGKVTYNSGTAQAGAPNSLTLAAGASTVADAYKGLELYIASGTGAGQSRNVVTSRENWIAYSRDFTNAAWAAIDLAVTPNNFTAPDGTLTASEFVFAAVASSRIEQRTPLVAVNGQNYVGSIWIYSSVATSKLSLQVVALPTNVGNEINVSLSVGWNRVFNAMTLAGANSGDTMFLYLIDRDGTGGTFYGWDAQLEVGTTPSTNIHTLANPAVGAIIDTPWTTVPDSTSVYEISLTTPANQMLMADLLTITLKDGSVSYLTSSDVNITYGGHTYLSNSIQFQRSKIKSVVGVKVDSLDLSLYGDSTTLIGGQSLKVAAVLGAFDGATIQLDRAFMQAWGQVVGTLLLFSGNAGQIDIGRTEVKINVTSTLELLNIQMPRNVWQPGCINTLYDTACGLARTAVAGATSAGSTALVINSTLTNPDKYFNLGYITYTSGVNAGLSRTIKSYTLASGQITLMNEFPTAPATSDAFNAFHGCDKQQATCSGYGNLARYRGFPYIPAPDVLT